MVPPPTRPASPSPMQMTTLCTLPSRILTARQNMLDTGFYLGDDGVLNNVHWVRDGRADRLAVKVATASNPADPGACDAISASYPSPPPEEKTFELAPLCAIMRISTHDFWLTADASYCKDSKVWRELVNVKPSCTLEVPDPQPIHNDFQKVMSTIHRLQEMVSTPGYQPGKGFILPGGIGGQHLKVRHALFEPLGTEEEESAASTDESTSSKADGSDSTTSGEEAKVTDSDAAAFSIENWPLTDEDARDELLSLKETHHIMPIPAYNLQGKLVKPNAYRRTLEEALVEIYFNMSHWSIAGKKGEAGSDVFTADIQMIHVIALPCPTVGGTPRKRKISLYVNPAASPNKKRRTS